MTKYVDIALSDLVFFILAIARLQNGAWISKIRQNMVKCSNGHLQKIMDLMIQSEK